MIYAFGDCELDTCLYTLRRSGQTIRMRPKAFRLCLYLLERRDRVVPREELCAQIWPGQFISQATLEGVIRAVRQAVGDNGQAQGIIQTLHGYGYRFVASVEERPSKGADKEGQVVPTLVQSDGIASAVAPMRQAEATPSTAGYGETRYGADTPNGNSVEVTASIPVAERPTGKPRLQSVLQLPRGVQALVIVILVLLGGWILWLEMRETETAPLDKSRIAVLPFVNLSADADHSYFADGMTEELITQLSQIRGLTVIARTSVMKYKGTVQDVATIGRELQVGTILEGSVRQVDNQVRITAQLVDVASQGHLWSHEYDRELKGVFEIQSDIATRVAQQLTGQMTAGERRRIEGQGAGDLEAYTLYLRGRYFRNQWTEESLRRAVVHFEQAVDRDPKYALAYAGIADVYLLLPFFAATTRPTEVYPRAMAAVEQALQHGDTFASVHTTVASAKLWYTWDWAGAESAFKRALALSPNDAATHRRYAWYLITMGRLKDAIAVMHRAQELNPLSAGITKNVGLVFYFAREYDQAIAQFRAALDLDPNFRTGYSGLAYAYVQQGRYAEALAACEQMLNRWGRDPWVLWDLGYALAAAGQRDQAREVLAELQAQALHVYIRPLAFAWISIGLAEQDQAFAWLDKAYADRDPYLTLINADPVYDNLRTDSRFTTLAKKIGLGR